MACRIEDINKHCLSEFTAHWKCLENKNMDLWKCRAEEKPYNACVFDKLVSYRNLLRVGVGGSSGVLGGAAMTKCPDY